MAHSMGLGAKQKEGQRGKFELRKSLLFDVEGQAFFGKEMNMF